MTILHYDLVGQDPNRPFSPHCWKVTMALAHKGLLFRSVPTPFTEVPHIENGATKTVPLIRDGGKLLSDSFAIAEYLETTYSQQASLFGGEGGRTSARFVERWSATTLHPVITPLVVMNIYNSLASKDQVYFREGREKRFGKTLESFAESGREAAKLALPKALEPLRNMLGTQDFIGGASPLFADYIVFGALQWLRVVSGNEFLEKDDPVFIWFERCLDLHNGIGRSVSAFNAN